jgi:hypothetical protein
MKELLIVFFKNAPIIDKSLNNKFDYVFSLNNGTSPTLIRTVFPSTVLDFENEFSQKLNSLFPVVRESFMSWSADWGNKVIFGNKSFKELFTWNGVSLWWFCKFVGKDSAVNNQYFYKLVYLFFLRNLLEENEFSITLHTDDQEFVKAIFNNFKSINYQYYSKRKKISIVKKICHFSRELIYPTYQIFKACAQLLVFRLYIGQSKISFLEKEKHIFFISLYSLNWRKENDVMVDRLFSEAPLDDQKYGEKAIYIVKSYLSLKQLINVRSLKENINKLSHQAQRPVLFVDTYIKFRDIFSIYFNVNHWLLYKVLKKSKKFNNSFTISNINAAQILIPEITRSFKGSIQECQFHGLAFQRFFEKFSKPQTVITYGEFLIANRAAIHCIKNANINNIVIAMQHSMGTKNKMHLRGRKIEFTQNDDTFDSINFSPKPDYFLVQGKQYKEIVQEFYPKEKIKIIGGLKYSNFYQMWSRIEEIRNKSRNLLNIQNNEKVILLAPSTNDCHSIFNIIKDVKFESNYRLLLSPHPVVDIGQIKSMQKELNVQQNIEYISGLNTGEVLTITDLVICGNSTVAIEAAIFDVPSIRAANYKIYSLFEEKEEKIPCFYDSLSFSDYLKKNGLHKPNNQIVHDYFYRIDGKASQRLWQFIISNKAK